MKRTVLAGVLVMLLSASATALAGAPQAIHYQGYLTNADGNPLDETVEMEFRLYDVEVAGEAFWSTPEAIGVDVENGVFRVNLAPVTAEQLAGGEVWLGITVIAADPGEPAQEMEPRLKVLSVPYALVAEHAATAEVAGEAAAVTNVDFSTFATGDDVQGVLGICIQEADLTDALQGYCAGPCYGDAEVELFVTENGYVTFDALSQWAEENIQGGLDEAALAAYLSANGYMTEADLLWFLGEAGFLNTEDLAGLGYVPGPHYTDGDVEALLATKNYCQGPCFSGSYVDLADKPSLDGHDADTVDGFDTNATGQPLAQTIPVTDESGKIPQELLPFSKGDLLAPADRQLVEGLDEYETGYFSVEELGIEGNVAANVKEGVKFGPGGSIDGLMSEEPHDSFAFWQGPDTFVPYGHFDAGIEFDKWEATGTCKLAWVQTKNAEGAPGEMQFSCANGQGGSICIPSASSGRHLFARYHLEGSNQAGGGVSCSLPGLTVSIKNHKYNNPVVHHGIVAQAATKDTSPDACFSCSTGGPDMSITLWLDDVRLSRYSVADEEWLNCEDGNGCTEDYLGGSGECEHSFNTNPCSDTNACTSGDVCGNGDCHGTLIDCDDGIPETTDDCNPAVGCVNETCASDVFEFADGEDGWQPGQDWVWDESGWLQGFGSTGALVSPQFSKTSSKLKVRYKCLGDGGLAFDPGPDVPCPYDGVWVEEFVDLGGATWLVQLTHYGAGSVLIDNVEVLQPCQ